MIIRMCIVTFRALRTMSVLVVTKHTANTVVQNCKVVSRPSEWVLICGHKSQIQGHYVLSRVWSCPSLCRVRLKLEEVPIWMGNLCLSVSPPQVGVMPLLKTKKNWEPKLCVRVASKVNCLNSLSGIRLLCVPVMVGTKIVPACEKVTVFGMLMYSSHKRYT